MAQGSIRTRCSVCRKAGGDEGACVKHPERVYQVLFREPGGKQRGRTFPSGTLKKEIDRWLSDRLSKIHDGVYRSPQKILFSEYVQKWLGHKKMTVSYKSYDVYCRVVRLHIEPILGGLRMFSVSPDDIREVLSRAQNCGIEPGYVNYIGLIMRMVFNDAMNDKACGDDPCKKMELVKKGLSKMQILTPAQAGRLLEVADELDRTRYMLSIFAGLRLNEGAALQVKDLNFDKEQINVRQSFHYAYGVLRRGGKLWHLVPPKTASGVRSVPMSRELKKALEIRLMHGSCDPDHYVLSGAEDPMTPEAVGYRLKQDLKQASCPKVRFHDLRHTFASFCINRNIPLTELQRMMGHSSIKTTSDTYGHLLPKDKGYLHALDDMVFGRVNTVSTKIAQNDLNQLEPVRITSKLNAI